MLQIPSEIEMKAKKPVKQRSHVPGLLRAFQKLAEEAAAKIAETSRQEAEKLAQVAARIEQEIRLEQGTTERDDQRLRLILSAATGGGLEKMLRHSPVLEQGDNRELLRLKGWRV
jgi:hypothetical protein